MGTLEIKEVNNQLFSIAGKIYERGAFAISFSPSDTDKTGKSKLLEKTKVTFVPKTEGVEPPFPSGKLYNQFIDANGKPFQSFEAFAKSLVMIMNPPTAPILTANATVTPPLAPITQTINLPLLTINHVNGTESVRQGVGIWLPGSIGIGLDGNHNVILSPDSTMWRSEPYPSEAVKLRVYSNVTSDDVSDVFLPNQIKVYRVQAYKNLENGATQGEREQIILPITLAGGSVIGDGEQASTPGVVSQIGSGGVFSPYYYAFGVQIPASAATKTYTFDIKLDFQEL